MRARSATGPVPQSMAAVGTAAPQRATVMIHPADHAAGAPTTTPSGAHTSPSSPPPRPRTVAGCDGRCGQQVGADRDEADLAGQRGDHGRAGDLGGQRDRDRLGHPPRRPAAQGVAPRRREQQDARRGEHGQREAGRHRQPRPDEEQPQHGDARARGSRGSGRCAPSRRARRCPSPRRVRRWARRARSARSRRCRRRPSTCSPRPRTPAQRPSTSRKPTTRVRLVPLTASRWVSPVVRKSSARSGSRPPSSPTTSAGTSSRASASRPATAARTDAAYGRGGVPPHVRAGDHAGLAHRAHERGHVAVAGHQPGGGLDRRAERQPRPVRVRHHHDRRGQRPGAPPALDPRHRRLHDLEVAVPARHAPGRRR